MAGEQERVLVVDDEKSILDLLEQILREAGYDVVTADNGQEALDKVSQLKVDLVLLDIKMPGMSGMEVLRQLISKRPETCIIMVTAVADAQTAVETMKLGVNDYITKPFNRNDIVLTVQRAIEKRYLLLQNERHRLEREKRGGEQAEQLQDQFVDPVETSTQAQRLIYSLDYSQRDGKSMLSNFPKELQEPISPVEEFSEAMIRILRREALRSKI